MGRVKTLELNKVKVPKKGEGAWFPTSFLTDLTQDAKKAGLNVPEYSEEEHANYLAETSGVMVEGKKPFEYGVL